MAGRAAYRFATAAAPARLDANLTAVELDLDRVLAIAELVSASTTFERPKEIALALDIGRTTYAGVEATKTHAVLGFDGTGLKIERLSIADIGGAAVEASGRIDNLESAGRGSVALSLIAGRIDGIAGLATKLMPQAVEPLRKYESRLGPLNIKARLDVEPRQGRRDERGKAQADRQDRRDRHQSRRQRQRDVFQSGRGGAAHGWPVRRR